MSLNRKFTKIARPLYTRDCEEEEIARIHDELDALFQEHFAKSPDFLEMAKDAVEGVIDSAYEGMISPEMGDFAHLQFLVDVFDNEQRKMKRVERVCPGAPKKTKRARVVIEIE